MTGFVIDLKELREVIDREVVSVYDHRHLNFEVAEFRDRQPTTENIAIAVWERLEGKVVGARLHRVRVYEQDDLFADSLGSTGERGGRGGRVADRAAVAAMDDRGGASVAQ